MRKARLFLCILATMTLSPAYADSPAKFLAGLDGEFKGRGMAILEFSDKEQRITCKLKNNFDETQEELHISGECASTQGKASVNGKLQIVDGQITGSFFSPFPNSEMTTSQGTISNGSLVVSAAFVNNETGNLQKVRQIVSRATNSGFDSKFQSFDNASDSYQDAGSMKFKRTQ